MSDGKEDEKWAPRICGSSSRAYVVNDPGCPFDHDPSMQGVYTDLESAQRAASHDRDNEIQSFMLNCDCIHDEHRKRHEETRDGWIYLSTGWEQIKPKKTTQGSNGNG